MVLAEDSCAATVNQRFNISILISEYGHYALCENFKSFFEEERNTGVYNVQTMVPVPFLLNKMHSS